MSLIHLIPLNKNIGTLEEFKGKASNYILRWTRQYFLLSLEAAEILSLESSQMNQTEDYM